MDPSYKSNYDTASGFDSAYSYLTAKHPEVKNPDVIAWDIAKLLNENHIEPLLKNLQIIDQILTSIGIPRSPHNPAHPDWIDQIARRMRDVSAADLGGDEMQKLHELLNSLGVPMLDDNDLALSVGERFTIVATELSGLRAAMEGKDKNKSVSANETTSVIPPDGSAYRAGLPPTLVLPLADQLTPELEAIRDEMRTMHANQSDLSTQVAAIGKSIQEQVVQDEKQARQVKATMDALLKRTGTIESELERDRREHRKESAALQRRIAELKTTVDRLSAVLASNNEDTQRRLIEEALDSFDTREVIEKMGRKDDEDAEAGKPSRLASPISQPIPQLHPISEVRDSSGVRITIHPWTPSSGNGTVSAVKTAPRPATAPRTKSRQEVRAEQLRQARTHTPKPEPVRQPPPSRLEKALATLVFLGVILGFAGNSLSTTSMVQLGDSSGAKVLQEIQVQYLTATEAIRERFPDVDLASTAMNAVTKDYNAAYEAVAMQQFDTWLRAKKTKAMHSAASALEKAGGFKYSSDKGLDLTYGIRKDGVKSLHWQKFLSLVYDDQTRNAGAIDDANSQAMWRLVDWLQGYTLPSRRGDNTRFYTAPTPEEWSAIEYTPLLSDPPGPASNCLLPPAVAKLKGKVPPSVIKTRSCPVQYLNTDVIADYEKKYPGQKELVLKVPETYWNRYCVVPAAINDVHNKTNVTVKELRAKACRS